MLKVSIQKSLPEFTIDCQFQLDDGILAIFGPSGAGKTTILRMIAGLTVPERGLIQFGQQVWYAGHTRLPAQKRPIGYVFQKPVLFPHMTVLDNLRFTLKQQQKLEEVIHSFAIESLLSRKPETISGGEAQRVAIARALLREPKLLLLDEPFVGLDREKKGFILQKLKDYLALHPTPAILVSHDLGEIMQVATYAITLQKGTIVKQGAPRDIFLRQHISGKFSFSGQVVSIKKKGLMYELGIVVDNQLIIVIATEDEAAPLTLGAPVFLLAKAFDPIVLPQENMT